MERNGQSIFRRWRVAIITFRGNVVLKHNQKREALRKGFESGGCLIYFSVRRKKKKKVKPLLEVIWRLISTMVRYVNM